MFCICLDYKKIAATRHWRCNAGRATLTRSTWSAYVPYTLRSRLECTTRLHCCSTKIPLSTTSVSAILVLELSHVHTSQQCSHRCRGGKERSPLLEASALAKNSKIVLRSLSNNCNDAAEYRHFFLYIDIFLLIATVEIYWFVQP